MLKGQLTELHPVSRNDLPYMYEWDNDEELTILASGSKSPCRNNNPLEALEAYYDENLTSHHLWEHGRLFIIHTISSCDTIGKCDYRDLISLPGALASGLLSANANTGAEDMAEMSSKPCFTTFLTR
ncbi:hypothetical protein [Thalassobacillus sp. CUG 92003]|uniref:hypothetical protein n=1 Tax=Thalassobacillus sp. CUG 92003 TaxID=2736641 RepID=UPI00210244C7|nr:hypothetical protein [Thalassobacillus sp. CUG 92003]